MLEKSHGKTNVQKLRVILLLEAYFNALYKIIVNTRVLPQLEGRLLVPQKIIGGINSQLAI